MLTKEGLNELSIEEQIKQINLYLKEGNLNLTKLCKVMGIGRSTLVDRFKKHNYIYNADEKSFVLIDTTVENKPIEVPKKAKNEDININTLLDRIESLERRVNDLESKATGEQYQINPINNNIRFYPKNSDISYTFRVNIDILNKFKAFCNEHSQYKQKDLLSSALDLYMELFEE